MLCISVVLSLLQKVHACRRHTVSLLGRLQSICRDMCAYVQAVLTKVTVNASNSEQATSGWPSVCCATYPMTGHHHALYQCSSQVRMLTAAAAALEQGLPWQPNANKLVHEGLKQTILFD